MGSQVQLVGDRADDEALCAVLDRYGAWSCIPFTSPDPMRAPIPARDAREPGLIVFPDACAHVVLAKVIPPREGRGWVAGPSLATGCCFEWTRPTRGARGEYLASGVTRIYYAPKPDVPSCANDVARAFRALLRYVKTKYPRVWPGPPRIYVGAHLAASVAAGEAKLANRVTERPMKLVANARGRAKVDR